MRDILWQEKLIEFMRSRMNEPFAWGTNDCITMAVDALVVIGGPDIVSHVRGKYKSEIGSKRVLAKYFPDGPAKYIDGKLKQVEVNFVQRGDLVMFDSDLGETFGIYWMGAVFSAGPEGAVLLPVPADKILRVWRV